LVINNQRACPAPLAEFLDNAPVASRYLWSVVGANVQLSPVPATSPTNTLYYIRPEPALTVDSQSPLIPEAHQAAVIARAAYYASVAKAQADAANFHNTEYENALRAMRDATKRETRPRQVRDVGTSLWATW
jgi:hypothetical protein